MLKNEEHIYIWSRQIHTITSEVSTLIVIVKLVNLILNLRELYNSTSEKMC